jgi:hypothetical protein
MEPELVLRGVFAHLVGHGVPLGVRDYLDALRALRAGHGGYTRVRLLWLCRALWARTDAEARAITLLFDQLPLPSDEEVAALCGLEAPQPAPARLSRDPVETPAAPAAEAPPEPGVGVSFAPPAQGGVGLPRARGEPASGELFILTPRPVVPLRSLVIVWRRFRAALRAGPPVELNLEATIDAKCRTGLLTAPALVPARRNQARVVVLVDASPSMQPWRDLGEVMRASLRQSQLGGWALRFFVNVPDELYADERLCRPEPVERLLREHPESTLLVVSDAGAARGRRGGERADETARFLARVSPSWRPAAWVNPMPRARWKGTAAERVAALRGVSMFEMTDDGLVQAVDVLRGRDAW